MHQTDTKKRIIIAEELLKNVAHCLQAYQRLHGPIIWYGILPLLWSFICSDNGWFHTEQSILQIVLINFITFWGSRHVKLIFYHPVSVKELFFLFFLSWWMFNIWVFESAFQTAGLFAGLYIPATKIKYSSFNCVIIILVLLLSCGFRIVYVPIFSSQKSMKIIKQCNRCGIVLGADLFLLTRFGLVVCVRVYVRMWHINGPINDHITTTSLFVLVLW